MPVIYRATKEDPHRCEPPWQVGGLADPPGYCTDDDGNRLAIGSLWLCSTCGAVWEVRYAWQWEELKGFSRRRALRRCTSSLLADKLRRSTQVATGGF